MSICNVPNCGRKVIAKGLCSAHWQRQRNSGNINASAAIGDKSGDRNPKWRGGQSTMPDGRVLIYCPWHPYPGVAGKYVLRYRLVMEKRLRRFLRENEVVHHINGDPTDDRIENLEVMTAAEHARLHGKTKGKMLTAAGMTMNVKGWAQHLGIDTASLYERIQKWGVDRALTTPKACK